ncbi:hypothetical protein XCR1_1650006 [Xenorhabdus cabanillasii JM26]|uniref:Uncharacterized protein n=1 Tax=Xenorhabdus cabanillasii JM26 TaxID=1427517 RepID=W1IX15_9GAMM|nr:hypothetical protein XCR1_1650006 [Xenorhabdus cabanillasii JM26]
MFLAGERPRRRISHVMKKINNKIPPSALLTCINVCPAEREGAFVVAVPIIDVLVIDVLAVVALVIIAPALSVFVLVIGIVSAASDAAPF